MSNTPETEAYSPGREMTYSDCFTNEQLHQALAKAVAERDEARRMLAAAKESLNAIHVEVGGWIAAMMKEGK